MDKEFIKKNWGERFKKLLKNPTGKFKEKRVKQKDLVEALDISENIVTQWKQGQWDIKLTSIYAIVEYFKSNYPNSIPMQRLFPDLVNNEIEREIQKVAVEYKTLKEDYEKLNKKYITIKKNVNKFKDVCLSAPPEIRKYFYDTLPLEAFKYFFKQDV